MTVNLSLFAGAGAQFFDNSGNVLTGGLIYTYAAGTTTPLESYTSSTGSTPNSNPVVLNAAGRVAEEIWLTAGSLYKFILKDANDVLIGSWDNIPGVSDSSQIAPDIYAALANTTDNTKGDALIGFKQSNASGFLTGAVGKTVNAKFQEFVSVKDFGATGDGSTDDTTAIQAALNAGVPLSFPPGTYKTTDTLTHTGSVHIKGNNATIQSSTLTFKFTDASDSSISGLNLIPATVPYTLKPNPVTWVVTAGDVVQSYDGFLPNSYLNADIWAELSPTIQAQTSTNIWTWPTIWFYSSSATANTNVEISEITGHVLTIALDGYTNSIVRDCNFGGGSALGSIMFNNGFARNYQSAGLAYTLARGQNNKIVNNNVCYGGYSNLWVRGNDQFLIQGNTTSWANETGIKLDQTDASTGAGIVSTYGVVDSNLTYNNYNDGIDCGAVYGIADYYPINCIFSNNQVINNKYAGMISVYADYATYSNNLIAYNGNTGLQVSGNNCTVTGNLCNQNSYHPELFVGIQIFDIILMGNNITSVNNHVYNPNAPSTWNYVHEGKPGLSPDVGLEGIDLGNTCSGGETRIAISPNIPSVKTMRVSPDGASIVNSGTSFGTFLSNINGGAGVECDALNGTGILRIRGLAAAAGSLSFMPTSADAASATPVGFINYDFTNNNIQFGVNAAIQYYMANGSGGSFSPNPDNARNLGVSALRWKEIFCANGTINTSDEREKQDIKDLSEVEREVAIGLKGLIKSFRFKDAVAKKGDKARIHFGVMAQQVAETFRIVGLNPDDYSLFCYDEWEADEALDLEAGNRYGIRYEQLLAFIIAAL